jgi:DNA-binding NarL/FixJ family response regulator
MPLAAILIEDSPEIRKSLIPAMAEMADVEVIATAETADQGIAALRTHADRWRLAVVDMLLKAGNGLQVLRAGRERRSDQRMVVLTNYATPDIRRKATECGADAVFDKSTEIEQFLELCAQYAGAQLPDAAHAAGDPTPAEPDGTPEAQKASAVEELLERVAIDRLLTEAVSGSVNRNAASVRDHLKRQGADRPVSPGTPPEESDPDRKGDAGGSTRRDPREGD